MKERPILFSGPMVRALLAGTKTQTRRVVNEKAREAIQFTPDFHWRDILDLCPYGQPGDRLWVKETTVDVERHGYIGPVYATSEQGAAILDWGLGPDSDDVAEIEPHEIRLRPSLFMTRKMSRILLEIVAVRVERLQDISEEDAKAEGVEGYQTAMGGPWFDVPGTSIAGHGTARSAYRALWQSINGPGSWDANPWVWAVEFKRV